MVLPTHPIYERGWLPPFGVEAFRRLLKLMFDVLAPIEVRGLENLPSTGGFIVAANHVSYWDAPLIFTQMRSRSQLTAFGADKYQHNWFMSFILRLVGVVWVNRDAPSPATIKAAVQVLRAGSVLGVAPEGTRSQATHALQEGKTGAVYLAVIAGVPIVPAALAHTDKVTEDLRHLHRSHVSITFGQPLIFPAPARQERDAKLDEYTEELMCQIAVLLPPEYRGVYADHPKLKALAQGAATAGPSRPVAQMAYTP